MRAFPPSATHTLLRPALSEYNGGAFWNIGGRRFVFLAMLIQVIHCHPLSDSFSHSAFDLVVRTLEANGHDVVATDLYAEGFDPVMSPAERASYMSNDYDG